MSVLDSIGNTPVVEITGLDTGKCRLFAKLESQNPGGSIKDRIAISMIADAEMRGALKPGGTIIEATAGNTGLGLALVGSLKGYRTLLVVPDKMSRDKIVHLKALGAEVVLTRSDVNKGHPDYYQDRAQAIARETPDSVFINQFENPANALAHEKTTGPEILSQMNHDVDAVVVGVGSGGTLGGLTRYFKTHSPKTELVIADPEGSIIAAYVQSGKISTECGSWLVEGIGEDFIPGIADFSSTKNAYTVSDKDSFLTAREVLRTTGLFVGSSTGTLIAAALRYCKEQETSKRVITFVCDGGSKYLSKMYSDAWMVEHGFISRKNFGDLRDFIAHPYENGSVVSVGPENTLQTALMRMKMYDISQLPVLQDGKIVGVLDETDLLVAMNASRNALKRLVNEVMTAKFESLRPTDSVSKVLALLQNGLVAIVADENQFYGLITKIDIVDFLRRSVN